MTATTTTSTWQSSPGHGHAHTQTQTHPRAARPSTTPRGRLPVSVGQAMPPQSSPSTSRSPSAKQQQQQQQQRRSPSPGYFGLAVNDEVVPPDSNPGQHARQNWIYTTSPRASKVSPRLQMNDHNPTLEAFRKQSETHGFALNRNNLALRKSSADGSSGRSSSQRADDQAPVSPRSKYAAVESTTGGVGSSSDIPRRESPTPLSPVHRTVAEHQHARLSLPTSDLQAPSQLLRPQRSDTVPLSGGEKSPEMTSASEAETYLRLPADQVLILDLRVYPQYTASRIAGALNLCIPTTLLKRPSFTVQKLADTLTSEGDKDKFATWTSCSHIIVYDANSAQAKDAVTPVTVLKKFFNLGWAGHGIIVRGGFGALAKTCPDRVDRAPPSQGRGTAAQPVSVSATSANQVPIAGGCTMPAAEAAANPFFGTIRQNMDLLDGVGQMAIQQPAAMSPGDEGALPSWLRDASGVADAGKQVSDKFLTIERAEQARMRQALSGKVSYGSGAAERARDVQIAGIEKGSKNRYNNIFPYDHSRVKLQNVPSDGCDYVNANHVQAAYTNRRYIATQAPIPATFDDFWRVVWEQDVRVIVMLTAESEGGQTKSHPYWNTAEYGTMKVKKLSERSCSLEKAGTHPVRPTLGARRTTQPHTTTETKTARDRKAAAATPFTATPATTAEPSAVTVRHFSLSHTAHPFQPMREVTQLHYAQWPDFGAPASPHAMLGLIEQVNKYVRTSASPSSAAAADDVAPAGQRPILVHCSAGCGRTGTFCTVDSVIDMLKRQKGERGDGAPGPGPGPGDEAMDVDVPDDWIARDDIDLVAKTVADFRQQRLSMVQNLRQFVLCYESVLEWVVSQTHQEHPGHHDRARDAPAGAMRGLSFHG